MTKHDDAGTFYGPPIAFDTDDQRVFHGPPLPLDDHLVSFSGVAFAAEEQPRNVPEPYRGKEMTPEYRRQLLNATPLGRQIIVLENLVEHQVVTEQVRDGEAPYRGEPLTIEYRRKLLAASPLGRRVLALEDAAVAQARE